MRFQQGGRRARRRSNACIVPSERLMAFLDNIWCVSCPERSATGFTEIQEELLTIGIRVHDRKTQLWNRSGQVPARVEALTAAAQRSDPEAFVWRGDISLPGGRASLSVSDLQCEWILLLCCAAASPNYLLRVVLPGLTARFAAYHDASLRRALSQLVSAPRSGKSSASLSSGCLGLRSAVLTTNAAYGLAGQTASR